MFKANGERRDFALDKDRVVVGRTSHCDLRIPLSSVSREHCELRVVDGRVKLRDLGSSNGTYHNSSRVQEATLKAGDEIVIGPVVFTVVIDGNPAKIEPVQSVIEHVKPAKPQRDAAPSEPPKPKPEALPTVDDDDEMPPMPDPENHSPTVDLDDPIAALEALAQAEDDEDIPLMLDDEDEDPPAKAG